MKLFGTQIDLVVDVWNAKHHLADCGAEDEEFKKKLKLSKLYTKLIMQIIISIAILVMCIFVVFTSDSLDTQKACFGLLGAIVGYWLR